jgi:hypothetical protein
MGGGQADAAKQAAGRATGERPARRIENERCLNAGTRLSFTLPNTSIAREELVPLVNCPRSEARL